MWPAAVAAPASRCLKDLYQASPDVLSIKFNVDGINLNQGPTLGQGRVVGTIGPATADEPKHFVLGRLLRPSRQQGKNQQSAFTFAPARVCTTRKKVTVDFGNSLPTTTPGGPIDSSLIGKVELAIVNPSGQVTTLGPVNYQANDWYTSTAGVQEFPDGHVLSDVQLTALESGRLALLPAGSGSVTPASRPPLIENASSSLLRAPPVRLSPQPRRQGDRRSLPDEVRQAGGRRDDRPGLCPAAPAGRGDGRRPPECTDVSHADDPRQDRRERPRPLHAQGGRPGQPASVHRRPGLWGRLLLAVGAAGPDPGRLLAVRQRAGLERSSPSRRPRPGGAPCSRSSRNTPGSTPS